MLNRAKLFLGYYKFFMEQHPFLKEISGRRLNCLPDTDLRQLLQAIQDGQSGEQLGRAISDCFSQRDRIQVQELLTCRSFKRPTSSFDFAVEDLTSFSRKLMIQPKDLLQMVKYGISYHKGKAEGIAMEYGLFTSIPKLWEKLRVVIEHLHTHDGLAKLQSVISQKQRQFMNAREKFYEETKVIGSAKQLKEAADKCQIFIDGQRYEDLYSIVKNIGLEDWLKVSQFTHPKFYDSLFKLLSLIPVNKPAVDYLIRVPEIIQYLKDAGVDQSHIQSAIIHCFDEKVDSDTILSWYINDKNTRQTVQKDLNQLIQHIDKQYQSIQINKILKYLHSVLFEDDPTRNQVISDYEIKLPKLLGQLSEKLSMTAQIFLQLIHKYYEEDDHGFSQLFQRYDSSKGQDNLKTTLKKELDGFVSHLSDEDKNSQKERIFLFLRDKMGLKGQKISVGKQPEEFLRTSWINALENIRTTQINETQISQREDCKKGKKISQRGWISVSNKKYYRIPNQDSEQQENFVFDIKEQSLLLSNLSNEKSHNTVQGKQKKSPSVKADPFSYKFESKRQSKMFVLIFFSEKKVEQLTITNGQQDVRICKQKSLNFSNTYIWFSLYKQEGIDSIKPAVTVQYAPLFGKKQPPSQTITLKTDKIDETYLQLAQSTLFKPKVTSKSLINFAVFSCIEFLSTNQQLMGFYSQTALSCSQDFTIPLFKRLSQLYDKTIDRLDQLQILNKLTIDSANACLHTRNLIIFLYEIYQQEAFEKIVQSKLLKKMVFSKKFQAQQECKSFSSINIFFSKIHLISETTKKDQTQYSSILNILKTNLLQQPKNSIYNMLITIGQNNPSILKDLDNQILEQAKSNSYITALHYFKIKMSYFQQLIHKDIDTNKYAQMVTKFIDNLLSLSTTTGKIPINQVILQVKPNQIEQLLMNRSFFSNPFFSKSILSGAILSSSIFSSSIFEMPIDALIDLYRKVKILCINTSSKINLVKLAKDSLISVSCQQPYWRADNVYQALTAFLTVPIDQQQLREFVDSEKLNFDETSVIRLLNYILQANQQRTRKYFISIFKQKMQKMKVQPRLQIINKIARFADTEYQKYENNKVLASFIDKIYEISMNNMTFYEARLQQQKKMAYLFYQNQLKILLLTCYEINSRFQQKLFDRLFINLKSYTGNGTITFIDGIATDIIKEHKIAQQDSQKFRDQLNIAFVCRSQLNLSQQIKNLAFQNHQILRYYRLAFKKKYDQALAEVANKIQKGDYSKQQIMKMGQYINRHPNRQQLVSMYGVVKGIVLKLEQTMLRIKVCREIIQRCFQLKQYTSQLQQLQDCQIELQKSQMLSQIIIRLNKNVYLNWLLPRCLKINYFLKIQFLEQKKYFRFKQFKEEYEQADSKMHKVLFLYDNQQLIFIDFKEYFQQDLLLIVAKDFCESEQKARQICQLTKKLSLDYLQEIQKYVITCQDFIECNNIQAKMKINQYRSLVIMIKAKQKLYLHKIIISLQCVQRQLINIFQIKEEWSLGLCLPKILAQNQLARILSAYLTGKPLFQMIQKRKIDSKMISDLKEYINESQSISLTFETVKQFEVVVEFAEMLRSVKDISSLQKEVKKFISPSYLSLVSCIEGCSPLCELIERKIQESSNRETSFRYYIEAILDNSTLHVSSFEDIRITVAVDKKQQVIDFKKLTSYRDKSILLIRDTEKKGQNVDKTIQELVRIFELYGKTFFPIVESLQQQSKKLASYGYSPALIIRDIIIKNKNFENLIKQKEEIQRTCDEWVQELNKLYAQSYLLCFFLGNELNSLVQCFQKNQHSPTLKKILQITEKDHIKRLNYQKQQFLELKNMTPLKKINIITNFFKKLQQNFKQEQLDFSIQQVSIRQSSSTFDSSTLKVNPPQITLLTCSSDQIYSCLLERQQLRATLVFFCEKSTRIEQLQLFFYRALHYRRNHYVVCAHQLRDDVKLACCDLLTSLLKDSSKTDHIRLVFVDHVVNDKLYAFIARPGKFSVRKKQIFEAEAQKNISTLLSNLPQTLVISSARPGLGKTFTAQQKVQAPLRRFPICGNVDFSRLANRLKELNIKQQQGLLIQIGHVENQLDLQIFLAQLVLFRCFYYEQYVFLPSRMTIVIELENIISEDDQKYQIVQILKKNKRAIHISEFKIQDFRIDFKDSIQKTVFEYLLCFKNDEYKQNQPCNLDEKLARQLLDKFFIQLFPKGRKIQPTFYQLKAFLQILHEAIPMMKSLGSNIRNQFKELSQMLLQKKDLKNLLITTFLKSSLDFLDETINSNEFRDSSPKQQQSLSEKINSLSLLIVPKFDNESFEFIYLKDESVPLPIKFWLTSQDKASLRVFICCQKPEQLNNIFKKTALNMQNERQQQENIYKIIYNLSGNQKFKGMCQEVEKNVAELKNYKLTLDNFFKMCLIINRSKYCLPSVIMGESGVGKTALINFLVKVILKQELLVFNVHAGIHQDDISRWCEQIRKKSQSIQKSKRFWVFFDEFNTTDEQDYLKQIVMNRTFQGQSFNNNIIFLAACNPYRRRQQHQKVRAGLTQTYTAQQKENNSLAFKVKPPSLSMIHMMWDFQQLGQKQSYSYIDKMLSDIRYNKRKELVKTIAQIHQMLKNVETSSVSLRDVARFRELTIWFINNNTFSKESKDEVLERAVILSLVFCYSLRFPTRSERQKNVEFMEQRLKFKKGYMQSILLMEQAKYVQHLACPQDKIAMNNAIMENIFVEYVCIMNKIPVLLIGNPGSSKSLSIKMLNSNLRGKNSSSQFCKKSPQINMIYFQGSQSSTSQGVEQVFEKALNSRVKLKQYQVQNCILFDEIGLAQKSIHNPLKVLHARLQTNCKEIAFIGISNWELDAAKMSRFLVLARSEPDQTDLRDTADKILKSYLPHSDSYVQKFMQFGSYYHKFLEIWKKTKNRQGFFGLRDFYSYVKYICTFLQHNTHPKQEDFNKAVVEAIMTNFDGQPESIKKFCQIANLPFNKDKILPPVELVHRNLAQQNSRCLLLIVRGDALIPLINSEVSALKDGRKITSIYGSTFKEDQQSEEYNLQMTSLVISHVSRGDVIVFKDINNSIQTSFFDLFNKSYTTIGNKKYCRIAVGANSNPKCFVHNNFNAIVYIDESNLDKVDLPFLNRFQKHYLTLQSMATQAELKMFEILQNWINGLLAFSEGMLLKKENFIYNCSEESLVTLLIRLRGSQDIIQQAKTILLQNCTTDLKIALKYRPSELAKEFEIDKYLKMRKTPQKCKEDMIIFTYDQFAAYNFEQRNLAEKDYSIRLNQILNERSLRRELKKAFGVGDWKGVEILLNYRSEYKHNITSTSNNKAAQDYKHINWLLFLAKQIKTESSSNRQIRIIIQLHRFSLLNSNIDYINISYLHEYEQFFIEDLRAQTINEDIFQSKSYKQLYEKLSMEGQFVEQFTETLQLVKFISPLSQNESLCEKYLAECMSLTLSSSFKWQAKKTLLLKLSHLTPNFQQLHSQAVDLKHCSNIQEALKLFVLRKVKQILLAFIKDIVENGLLFHYKNKNALQFQSKKSQQDLKDSFQNCSNFLNNVFESLKNKAENLSVVDKPYQLLAQGNHINIGSITLIPGVCLDFKHLLGDDQFDSSLAKFASKIPFSQTAETQNDYSSALGSCKEHLERFQILKLLSCEKTQPWKKLYLYDLGDYLLKEWKISTTNIMTILNFIENSLPARQISYYLIALTKDCSLTTHLFELINLLLQKISEKQFLQKVKSIQCDEGAATLKLMQYLFDCGAQYLKRKEYKVVNQQRSIQYSDYKRQLYMKMREIIISYEEFGLVMEEECRILHQFYEMLNKIKISINDSINEIELMNTDKSSIFSIIFEFCQTYLVTQIGPYSQTVLEYLSLSIFGEWLQLIRRKDSPYLKEYQKCFSEFIKLCNKNISFANNSTYFFSILFEQFDHLTSLHDMQEQVYGHAYCQTCQQSIQLNVQEKFTVALGNYIFGLISKILVIQFQQQAKYKEINQYICFKYLQKFQISLKSQVEGNLFSLFDIQFAKRYCLSYLQLLIKNKENEIQNKIDCYIMNSKTEISNYLQIFMLEHLLHVADNSQKWRKTFVERSKCEWIKHHTYISKSTVTINSFFKFKQNKDLKSIKLFKPFMNDVSPSVDNMLRYFEQQKKKQYPLLLYLAQNCKLLEKLNLIKEVFMFLRKLWKVVNRKITRSEANKSIKQVIEGVPIEQQQGTKEDLDSFIASWNTLFQDGGNSNRIQKKTPLLAFLLIPSSQFSQSSEDQISLVLLFKNIIAEYNKFCFSIEQITNNMYASNKSASLFSKIQVSPTQLTPSTKLLSLSKSKIEQIIQISSSFSVAFEDHQPHYAYEHIQSELMKEVYGSHYFIHDMKQYDYFSFVGEQTHFLTDLRGDSEQKTLQELQIQEKIKNWEKQLNKKGETQFKIIKNVQNALESIIIYYKNNRKGLSHDMTVGSLIKQRGIKLSSSQLCCNPFESLPLSSLSDLYERVQMLSFEQTSLQLDKKLQKSLDKDQMLDFNKMVKFLKFNKKEKEELSYNSLREALIRLACRNPVFINLNSQQEIGQYIFSCDKIWPKNTNLAKLNEASEVKILKNLKFKHLQAILNQMQRETNAIDDAYELIGKISIEVFKKPEAFPNKKPRKY